MAKMIKFRITESTVLNGVEYPAGTTVMFEYNFDFPDVEDAYGDMIMIGDIVSYSQYGKKNYDKYAELGGMYMVDDIENNGSLVIVAVDSRNKPNYKNVVKGVDPKQVIIMEQDPDSSDLRDPLSMPQHAGRKRNKYIRMDDMPNPDALYGTDTRGGYRYEDEDMQSELEALREENAKLKEQMAINEVYLNQKFKNPQAGKSDFAFTEEAVQSEQVDTEIDKDSGMGRLFEKGFK
jgi:hypothetical protein